MTILRIQNGDVIKMPGLGKIVPLSKLNEKRITKAVREKLRSEYGAPNVRVNCSANFSDGAWHGKCIINNKQNNYSIRE